MDEASITEKVKERFGDRLRGTYAFQGQHAVTVQAGDLRAVLTWLRDEPGLEFDWLMDLAGVDYLGYGDEDEREWRFEVVYQMYSLKHHHRFRIKVAVPEDDLQVPSIWDLWGVANWMEREVWDLYGIQFPGHPNLRRILCHDEFVGHALRKDYPINKRQKFERPSDVILCDKVEWA